MNEGIGEDMQTLGYSMLVLLPLAVGVAVLFFGERWRRQQNAADAEEARRCEKERLMSGIL